MLCKHFGIFLKLFILLWSPVMCDPDISDTQGIKQNLYFKIKNQTDQQGTKRMDRLHSITSHTDWLIFIFSLSFKFERLLTGKTSN